MNRKLKLIGTAILIATFASTFSACSDTKTDEQARYMRVYGTIYNDGELIVTENPRPREEGDINGTVIIGRTWEISIHALVKRATLRVVSQEK